MAFPRLTTPACVRCGTTGGFIGGGGRKTPRRAKGLCHTCYTTINRNPHAKFVPGMHVPKTGAIRARRLAAAVLAFAKEMTASSLAHLIALAEAEQELI